jgi:hypothetical protein
LLRSRDGPGGPCSPLRGAHCATPSSLPRGQRSTFTGRLRRSLEKRAVGLLASFRLGFLLVALFFEELFEGVAEIVGGGDCCFGSAIELAFEHAHERDSLLIAGNG